MSVSLSPSNALGFNRPLTTLVKRSLTITNHNAQPVAFKVKTTAPKLYCVRPNSGRVDPGQSLDVSVMLQPLKDEPPLNAKCKDKFLIQSTLITSGKEALPLPDIWTATDGGEEAKVHQQKLRVVYLPAEGQTLVEEDEEAQTNMSSMMMSTGDSRFDTVRQNPTINGDAVGEAAQSMAVPRPSTPPADFSVAQEEPHDEHPSFDAPGVVITPPEASEPALEREPEAVPAVSPAPVPAPASVPVPVVAPPIARTPSVPTPAAIPVPLPPTDDYAAKYAEAQAEIERLRALLATSQPPAELRRRTRKLSDDGTAVDVAVLEETPIHEGVPLQVVVIIALGVFITTYLFF
ncbi:PapD-like protein [Mycena maculata]|uniref:PapD-like protein n=1 Tax=Mycena maculata TaxID=230809 RepID=A0AAD7JE95_9AGAR|nr:PapD-like protein [Mycena maculata]